MTWSTVERDGLPPCDGETVYVGVNSAGFACCFNQARPDGLCLMGSPECSTAQMSELRWWRVLDRPDTSGVPVGDVSFRHKPNCGTRFATAGACTCGVTASGDGSAWWALVMCAAASIEDAANCLRDPDAKKQAEGAAKHYREAAQKLMAASGVMASDGSKPE